MIAYCEIHKQFLTNYFDSKRPTCCQILFDSEPFYTIKGTCYKTKIRISEHSPFVYSSIKIWMQELKDKTLGRSVGNTAAEQFQSNHTTFQIWKCLSKGHLL